MGGKLKQLLTRVLAQADWRGGLVLIVVWLRERNRPEAACLQALLDAVAACMAPLDLPEPSGPPAPSTWSLAHDFTDEFIAATRSAAAVRNFLVTACAPQIDPDAPAFAGAPLSGDQLPPRFLSAWALKLVGIECRQPELRPDNLLCHLGPCLRDGRGGASRNVGQIVVWWSLPELRQPDLREPLLRAAWGRLGDQAAGVVRQWRELRKRRPSRGLSTKPGAGADQRSD